MAITRITASSITGLTIPNTSINNASLDSVTALPSGVGGKILAVYQDYSSTQVDSSTDNSYIDVPDLAITLTPNSSSSKFWLSYNTHGSNNAGASQALNVSIDFKRAISGGTTTSAIINATDSGALNRRYNYDNRSNTLGINYLNCMLGVTWLDSPSTASAITYTPQFNKYQWAGTSGTSMGVNGGLFQILEIGA
jgi:hypothetical protein